GKVCIRLYYGTIQSGKEKEVLAVLDECVGRVKQLSECLLAQLLQSGNEMVGMSTWETQETLAAYADGEVARALFTRITPFVLGRPTVRSYEVKRSVSEQEVKKECTFPIPPFFNEL